MYPLPKKKNKSNWRPKFWRGWLIWSSNFKFKMVILQVEPEIGRVIIIKEGKV